MAGYSQMKVNQSMPTSLQIPHPPLCGLATLWLTMLYGSIYIPWYSRKNQMKNVSIYYLLCEREGEEKYQRLPLFTRTASATIKQCSILLTLSPKHSYFPPPLEENFNVPEHYLQRGMFMHTGENVNEMERWQRIITLIPPSNQQQYFKGNLDSSRERNQKKSNKIFIGSDHTNLEQ